LVLPIAASPTITTFITAMISELSFIVNKAVLIHFNYYTMVEHIIIY